MTSPSESSNGQGDIVRLLNKLRDTHKHIVKNKSRIWLMKSLADRSLTTRDVYLFVFKQARIRSSYRT